MFNVLVVEDDLKLNRLFCTVLEKNGYRAVGATNGQEALDYVASHHLDLVICDVLMPVMDGFALTRTLRAVGLAIPVLVITARGAFEDKKQGFVAGADDYMVKPIDVGEMVLRVGALLRRAEIVGGKQLAVGQTALDYDSLTVSWEGREMQLPQKEFNLLYKLLSFPGRIFTRQQLMDEIWGVENESDERTVDVHVSRLRERFKDSPDFQIVTIRGLGYKAVKNR